MKKVCTLFLCLALSVSGFSTIHAIQVADFTFTPSLLNVTCGDTVTWNWVSGTHTTTSTTIPACANPWNASITVSTGDFSIAIPCAGTYSYNCTIHPNMTGSIVATCLPSSVGEPMQNTPLIYPNPFRDKIYFNSANFDKIVLYNILGKQLLELKPDAGMNTSLETAELPSGIYILSFYNGEIRALSRKVIKK